ncbi:MAG: hypothetical protein IBX64_11635 [Actinobacteria bacterium]|nr:hypothetical protein [Actinomycetota bacterium]
MKLVDYTPANKLISQVKDTLDAPETPPLGFGSYQDILLVEVGGNTKWWIWAIQNDTCIGKIYVNTKEKRMVTYKDDKVVDEKHFPEAPDEIRLPRM